MIRKLIVFSLLLSCKSGENDSKPQQVSNASSGIPAFFDLTSEPYINHADEIKKLKFDVNDVSFMWPYKTPHNFEENHQKDYLLLVKELLSAEARNLPSLQTLNAFEKFVSFSDPTDLDRLFLPNPYTGVKESLNLTSDTFLAVENYEIISVRFDDCGQKPTHESQGNVTTTNFFDFKEQKVRPYSSNYTPPEVKLVRDKKAWCMPQMRLVAIPFFKFENEAEHQDGALHIIYNYSEKPENFFGLDSTEKKGDYGILKNLMQDLQVLKFLSGNRTSGKPLGIHPGLKDVPQNWNGTSKDKKSIHQHLKNLILHYAKPKYLTKMAVLSTNTFDESGLFWNFNAVELKPNGQSIDIRPIPIFNHEEKDPRTASFENRLDQYLTAAEKTELNERIYRENADRPAAEISILANEAYSKATAEKIEKYREYMKNILGEGAVSQAIDRHSSFANDTYKYPELPVVNDRLSQTKMFETQRGFDDVAKILNPFQQTVEETDCISCHFATMAMFHSYYGMNQTERQFFPENLKKIIKSQYYFKPVKGITAFADPKMMMDFGVQTRSSLTDPVISLAVNFHSFSNGQGGEGSISLRAVYDSAATAASFNRRLFNDPTGPGQKCSDEEFVNFTMKAFDARVKSKLEDKPFKNYEIKCLGN